MKTLYIVRHAKASWDYPNLPDIDRPIIDKGVYNTKVIVAELNKKNISVELMVSSHAKRAQETARIIATGINYPVEKIEVSKLIYQCYSEDIFNIIFAVKDTIDTLLIVGHNPTLTQFANYFLSDKIDLLPTSGVISISFETGNWNEITSAAKKINFTLFPKLMK